MRKKRGRRADKHTTTTTTLPDGFFFRQTIVSLKQSVSVTNDMNSIESSYHLVGFSMPKQFISFDEKVFAVQSNRLHSALSNRLYRIDLVAFGIIRPTWHGIYQMVFQHIIHFNSFTKPMCMVFKPDCFSTICFKDSFLPYFCALICSSFATSSSEILPRNLSEFSFNGPQRLQRRELCFILLMCPNHGKSIVS